MKKMILFFKLDRKMKRLFIEAYMYLAWAWYLKRAPFSKIAPTLGTEHVETNFLINPSQRKTLTRISEAIHLVSRYTFWESACLVQAIAAMKMLEKRQIESTLYLGTAKDSSGTGMIAHAWLRSGPLYITGAEGIEDFTVVSQFAKTVE